jgi:anti-anti-sigma factor
VGARVTAAAVDGFDIELGYDYGTGDLIAVVRGEIDIQTARDLRSVLDAATATHTSVTLDVAAVTFCDAAGLHVIEDLALRLAQCQGDVVLRAPTPMLRRLLDITGIAALVTVVAATPSVVDAPQVLDPLADAIADTVAPYAHEPYVDATMRLVATFAESLTPSADAVSITLLRRDRFVTVASTNLIASDLDRLQYAAGNGPCVAAATRGETGHGAPGTDVWEPIAHAARDLDVCAVLSTPIGDGGPPLGSLNLYACGAPFGDADRDVAARLVAEAARIATIEPLDRPVALERVRDALRSRDTIARAQGIVMEREHISARDAYIRLRRRAITTRTALSELAARTIDDAGRPDRSREPRA